VIAGMRKPAWVVLSAVIVVVLAAASSVAAPSAGRGGSRGIGQRQTGAAGPMRLGPALGLTAEQTRQVQAIVREHRQQVQRLMQSNLSPDQKRAKRQELRRDMLRRINGVLTPKQREKARAYGAGWAQGLRAGRGQGRGVGQRPMLRQGARLRLEALNLSPKQRDQIAAMRKQAAQAVRDVRANPELSDRAKQDRIGVIRRRTQQHVMSVLTPKQRERLEQMRPGPRQSEPVTPRRAR